MKYQIPIVFNLPQVTYTLKVMYIYICTYICMYIYVWYICMCTQSSVMKTIECVHPPHHHNGFVLVEHSVCHGPISVLIDVFRLLAWCLLSTLLVLTLTMRELRHWPSIAGMLLQSHCGDEEYGRIGLSSWLHYICIMLLALCLLSTKINLLMRSSPMKKLGLVNIKVLPDLNMAPFFVFIKLCCLLFKFYVSITFDSWILISSVFNQISGNREEKDVSKL